MCLFFTLLKYICFAFYIIVVTEVFNKTRLTEGTTHFTVNIIDFIKADSAVFREVSL